MRRTRTPFSAPHQIVRRARGRAPSRTISENWGRRSGYYGDADESVCGYESVLVYVRRGLGRPEIITPVVEFALEVQRYCSARWTLVPLSYGWGDELKHLGTDMVMNQSIRANRIAPELCRLAGDELEPGPAVVPALFPPTDIRSLYTGKVGVTGRDLLVFVDTSDPLVMNEEMKRRHSATLKKQAILVRISPQLGEATWGRLGIQPIYQPLASQNRRASSSMAQSTTIPPYEIQHIFEAVDQKPTLQCCADQKIVVGETEHGEEKAYRTWVPSEYCAKLIRRYNWLFEEFFHDPEDAIGDPQSFGSWLEQRHRELAAHSSYKQFWDEVEKCEPRKEETRILGEYHSADRSIHFYQPPEKWHRIVQIHERMHALHHLLPDASGNIWNDFPQVHACHKELLAQLFTYKYLKDAQNPSPCPHNPGIAPLGQPTRQDMDQMAENQSLYYRTYQLFHGISDKECMAIYWVIRTLGYLPGFFDELMEKVIGERPRPTKQMTQRATRAATDMPKEYLFTLIKSPRQTTIDEAISSGSLWRTPVPKRNQLKAGSTGFLCDDEGTVYGIIRVTEPWTQSPQSPDFSELKFKMVERWSTPLPLGFIKSELKSKPRKNSYLQRIHHEDAQYLKIAASVMGKLMDSLKK